MWRYNHIPSTNELYHYGVKGMKWGVRRTPEQLGHRKTLKKALNSALMKELFGSGEKCTPKDIIAIDRNRDGKIIWLEKGSESAGLKHILRHEAEFADVGISKSDIADFVMKAATTGSRVGQQGAKNGRDIFECEYDGAIRRVAVTIGSNGYIVGANPRSVGKGK